MIELYWCLGASVPDCIWIDLSSRPKHNDLAEEINYSEYLITYLTQFSFRDPQYDADGSSRIL